MTTKEAIVSYLREQNCTRTPEMASADLGIPTDEINVCVLDLAQSGDKTITYRCGVLGLREWQEKR